MKSFTLILGFVFLVTIGFSQNNNSKMEQRLSFITLGVVNLSNSADFYENKFGWTRSEMSNDQIVFFQLNGILLSLYDRNKLAEDATIDSSGNGFKGFTLSYLTRSEKEVDEFTEALSKKGVPIVKKPQKVFWGGYHSYISDPDGFYGKLFLILIQSLNNKGLNFHVGQKLKVKIFPSNRKNTTLFSENNQLKE